MLDCYVTVTDFCIFLFHFSTFFIAMHFILCGLLVANIPMALYFSLVHQRGTVAVMQYLRNVS